MQKKILIADDEDAVRCGISKYIQLHTDRFDKIYTARNGQEALDLIVLHRPDILLLDIQMPLKNGVEVMREASEMGIMPVTIVLSGYDEFQYAQQAVRYGARDYLLKPSRSSDILALVHKIADEVYGREAERPAAEEPDMPMAVLRAKQYVTEHYHEDISAQQAAEYAGITPGYLSTLFNQYCGYGFSELVNSIRIDRACTYLEQGYFKNYEIAYRVGYRDEKYFSRIFKKIKGVSPAEYKKRIMETRGEKNG